MKSILLYHHNILLKDYILYKTAVVNYVKMLMRNEVEGRISTTINHTDYQSIIISSAGKISYFAKIIKVSKNRVNMFINYE